MSFSNKNNEGVLFFNEDVVKLNKLDITTLSDVAAARSDQSARICTHKSDQDYLHEMVILHSYETYVRPHKHLNKSVSFHVVEGQADVVLFDEEGEIQEVVPMGDPTTGTPFYCRLPEARYYTQVVRSEIFVFHEVILGPFDRSATVWADWAPGRDEINRVKAFMQQLVAAVDAHKISDIVRGPKS